METRAILDLVRRTHLLTISNLFVQAGAQIHPTLEPAHIIMGIKETPLDELVSSPVPSPLSSAKLVPRTHLMFSHTTKGQPYNMELLSRFLRHGTSEYDSAKEQEKGLEARLIDYELLAGKDGKRTVGFGWFAGGGWLISLRRLCNVAVTNESSLLTDECTSQLPVLSNRSQLWLTHTSKSELPAHFW